MSSNLFPKEGIFDPTKRFAFTNITNAPFTFKWNSIPTTVESGETVELPHYLAVHATQHLVDQIMQGEAREDTLAKQKINPMYKAENVAGNMGIPAARKVWEDKILVELSADKSSDKTLGIKRREMQEQILKDLTAQPSPTGSVPVATEADFIDIPKS